MQAHARPGAGVSCKINPHGGECDYDQAGRCRWCNGKRQGIADVIGLIIESKAHAETVELAGGIMADCWSRVPMTVPDQWAVMTALVSNFLLSQRDDLSQHLRPDAEPISSELLQELFRSLVSKHIELLEEQESD